MRFKQFSPKQLAALCWWCPGSAYHSKDAIICDGAVRSGKSLCLSISFVLWSLHRFDGESFALCGKTVTSLRRNVVTPLIGALREMGYAVEDRLSRGMVEVTKGGRTGRYYLFGGKDEGSAALIQGVTLAGILLDEVALMPRSFVEQALARCSVEGSRFWFNCNPGHPGHWFYTQWITQCQQRNACYLHFTMKDNPSLSPAIIARYEKLYSGVFYRRYVLGEWVAVHGAVYPMFSAERHVVDRVPVCGRYVISCDYGTVNPASFGLWGYCEAEGVWYRESEYYHDSRATGIQRTDEEYCDALEALARDRPVEKVLVDPSAASFLQSLRKRGKYTVLPARNDVAAGIRQVANMLSADKLRFHVSCGDCIREFSMYRWNVEAGNDAPVKENDHAMDDLRYFVASELAGWGEEGFAVVSACRDC